MTSKYEACTYAVNKLFSFNTNFITYSVRFLWSRPRIAWCVFAIGVHLCPSVSTWVSVRVNMGLTNLIATCLRSRWEQERLAVLIVLLIQYCFREGNSAYCFLRQNFPRFLFSSYLARLWLNCPPHVVTKHRMVVFALFTTSRTGKLIRIKRDYLS